MRVTHLSLVDFRNYHVAEVPLLVGPNLIVGRNGQGKTNLVEAIAYMSTLRSHRVSGDAALVRAGQDSSVVRLRVEDEGRSVLLELQINRVGANRAQVNRNTAKPRDLMRWFSSVTFAPEDLSIVRGEPATRRRFLDDALVLRSPSAAVILADYERVVRQRTTLLKSARRGDVRDLDSSLSLWDDQLVELGSRIMVARRQLVADLVGPVAESYMSLVGGDHGPRLSITESGRADAEEFASRHALPPNGDSKGSVSRETSREGDGLDVSRETVGSLFRESLSQVRQQELERGMTLVGPHRDDLVLELNDLPVKGYASHGEAWSFALSLKLGLAAVVRSESLAGDPVIILDDVFAELDARRRQRLMGAVADYEQVIVTAAVEDDVPGDLPWNRITIVEGRVQECDHALVEVPVASQDAEQ